MVHPPSPSISDHVPKLLPLHHPRVYVCMDSVGSSLVLYSTLLPGFPPSVRGPCPLAGDVCHVPFCLCLYACAVRKYVPTSPKKLSPHEGVRPLLVNLGQAFVVLRIFLHFPRTHDFYVFFLAFVKGCAIQMAC